MFSLHMLEFSFVSMQILISFLISSVICWLFSSVLPGTLIPSAQRLVWAAKQPLGNAALGALFA